jgi:cytoskeletal protein CcmA (bactofilin family)
LRNYTLRGNGLFFVVALIAVLALLLLALLSLIDINNAVLLRWQNSSVNIEFLQDKANYAAVESIQPNETQIHNHSTGNTMITVAPFGVFEHLLISSSSGRAEDTIVFQKGYKIKPDQPVLYVADHGQPILIAGKTRIVGSISVPNGKVERGNIGGKHFRGRLPNSINASHSSAHIPVWAELHRRVEQFTHRIDSVRIREDLQELPIYWQRFSHLKSTQYFMVDGTFTLSDSISGNTVLYASDTLYVRHEAKVSGAVLCAPVIQVEQGFQGKGQFIAFESLTFGDRTQLDFPSIALIYGSDESILKIGKDSNINGMVVFLNRDSISSNLDVNNIQLYTSSTITGLIWSEGKIGLKEKTKINGSIYGESFQYFDVMSTYDNYLYNIRIEPLDTSEHKYMHAIPLFSNQSDILQWLN